MKHLQNSYYLMRHGESKANTAGLIISEPQVGCRKFGLSKQGQEQVKIAVATFQETVFTHVICSDFLRTRQTANFVTQQLNLSAPQLEVNLRERYFGECEGLPDTNYQEVWQQDEIDDEQVTRQVESPAAVQQRGMALLARLEQKYKKQCLLLVSHGDMLQILRTAFTHLSAGKHRQLPHHKTAEIRLLVKQGQLKPNSWPQL